jgi:hypothetical protein
VSGFLSRYADTTTIELGDGYWVKVRTRLARGAFRRAQGVLIQPILRFEGTVGTTSGAVDTVGYQNELAFHAIADWNLTDEADNPLPLSPDDAKRASIDRLPEEVFDKIVAAIGEGTPVASDGQKTPEAAAADAEFPAVGVGGSAGVGEPA